MPLVLAQTHEEAKRAESCLLRDLNRRCSCFIFAICHLPFAICHLPFAICHLLCPGAAQGGHKRGGSCTAAAMLLGGKRADLHFLSF